MLTLTVIKGGSAYADYLESRTAGSYSEYLMAEGEAPGYWFGRGIEQLGLQDGAEVDADAFRAVMMGSHPDNGEQLTTHQTKVYSDEREAVVGYEFIFSAPKSVSVAYALSEPEIANVFRDAHRHAVDMALGWVDSDAIRARSGRGGATPEAQSGIVATVFFQRTNREGEPQLHSHSFVHNLVMRTSDEKWRAIDFAKAWRYKHAAGAVYRAELRKYLAEHLAVGWEQDRRGLYELAGFNRDHVRSWSTRTAQVEDDVNRYGRDSAKARAVAAMRTRKRKAIGDETASIYDYWKARAAELDMSAEDILTNARQPAPTAQPVDRFAVFDVLRGDEGVTARRATFSRVELIRSLADAYPNGRSLADLQADADLFLADPDVTPLDNVTPIVTENDVMRRADRRAVRMVDTDEQRYTLRPLLIQEVGIAGRADELQHQARGQITTDQFQRIAAAHGELDIGQRRMLLRILRSGDGVDVIVGDAGSGKTHALGIAVEALDAAGYDVRGAAHMAKSAARLADEGITDSTTLAHVHSRIVRRGETFTNRTVLLVDEAEQAGTRELAPVASAILDAGGKVVFLGDDKQLGAVDAGGMFRYLTHNYPGTVRLQHTHRFLTEHTTTFAETLAAGRVAEALQYADTHTMIHGGPTFDHVQADVVAEWKQLTAQGQQVAVYASTWPHVTQLNASMRAELRTQGHISDDTLTLTSARHDEPVPLAAGDRIVFTHNDHTVPGVKTGTQAQVVDCGRNHNNEPWLIMERVNNDGTIMANSRHHLRTEYLQAGHVEHGYCTTTDYQLGATVDHALYYAGNVRCFEEGYVGGSRARYGLTLYIPDQVREEAFAAYERPQDERAAIEYASPEQIRELLDDHDRPIPNEPVADDLSADPQYWRDKVTEWEADWIRERMPSRDRAPQHNADHSY